MTRDTEHLETKLPLPSPFPSYLTILSLFCLAIKQSSGWKKFHGLVLKTYAQQATLENINICGANS
jgi:hypothetical protein